MTQTETKETNGQAEDTEIAVERLEDGIGALEAVDRAEIDIQVATAKKFPRSVDKSLKQAMTLATLDEETAASMFYALPRSGKTIEGPSARLAEIMAYSWGNLRADAATVGEDRTHVTAVGTCFDLEKNVAVRIRVKRRITDRDGNRYNEDMIGVTSNAAISIALRNAVFKVIPAALVGKVYRQARRASLGKAGTMEQKRQNAVAWFGKLAVQPEQVFKVLDVNGLEDITEDHLITLRGLRNALEDGETTVRQVFDPPKHAEGTEDLNEALGESGQDEEAPEEEDDGSPPTDSQKAKLEELMEKAGEADVLTDEEAEDYGLALNDENGPVVREGIRELQKKIAQAGDGEQAGLGV